MSSSSVSSRNLSPRLQVAVYLLFVLVTSFFTYLYHYNFPSSPFWDEPYHIAAAQKYLHKVYFMEQHPPLGKLLIALGERVTRSNERTDQFLTTDYAREFDVTLASGEVRHTNFSGYRLFPSLLGWLSSALLFFIFLSITRNPVFSALLSFLYIFDNAEILQSRAAMLDSTLTFFSLGVVLSFFSIVRLHRQRSSVVVWSLVFGLSFALALTTKLVALILVLLVPFIVWRLRRDLHTLAASLLMVGLGFCVAFVSVWQLHFSLSQTVVPQLSNGGYYEASEPYREHLQKAKITSLLTFPMMLRDSLRFVGLYNAKVPRLDLCKADENGSPSYFWPLGARTINYRWEKSADTVRYLYLVSNPVAWGMGLLGVLLSLSQLLSRFCGDRKEQLAHEREMIAMLALYIGYMLAISSLGRVMYLYHYFLPLLFSFILFALSFVNVKSLAGLLLTEERRLLLLTLLGLAVFGSFHFYRPLTYYEPLTTTQFQRRALLPIWEMACIADDGSCPKVSSLVVPRH